MNLSKIFFGSAIVFIGFALSLSSCKKLALQKDYNRAPDTVDTHVYMTAWDYLKKRALGTNANDTIWKAFYNGIIYSGIDTNEYSKPNRTYIFPNTEAITRTNSNLSDVGFYGAVLVNGKSGKTWTDYPKDFVKAYLQYLIADGVYNHYTLPPTNAVEVTSIAPPGSFDTLPKGITFNSAYPFVPNHNSKMTIQVLNSSPSNTSDYPIQLNGIRNVRTSSIQATNGTIHAIDRFLTTTLPQ
jgi:hypothetical protein